MPNFINEIRLMLAGIVGYITNMQFYTYLSSIFGANVTKAASVSIRSTGAPDVYQESGWNARNSSESKRDSKILEWLIAKEEAKKEESNNSKYLLLLLLAAGGTWWFGSEIKDYFSPGWIICLVAWSRDAREFISNLKSVNRDLNTSAKDLKKSFLFCWFKKPKEYENFGEEAEALLLRLARFNALWKTMSEDEANHLYKEQMID